MGIEEYKNIDARLAELAIQRGLIKGTAEFFGFIEGAQFVLYTMLDIEHLEHVLNEWAHTYANGLMKTEADRMRTYADYMAGGRFIIDKIKMHR